MTTMLHVSSCVAVSMMAVVVMGVRQANVFDFIIVGGGTAGCVMAGRLCTALPRARILLLEQGKPRSKQSEFFVRASRNYLDGWYDPSISQFVETEPEPALNNRRLTGIAGTTLGGASSLNAGQFTFPGNGTFASWDFAHLSDQRAFQLLGKIKRRLQVSPCAPSRIPDYTTEWLAASEKAGFRITTNPHDGSTDDVMHLTEDVFDDVGRRQDSCTGYIKKPLQGQCRQRLRLLQGAKVERILLRKVQKYGTSSTNAYGVAYNRMGKKFSAIARREVILSAGPYSSPQVLQLSGIGPADVLRRARVPLVQDLPVGNYGQGRALVTLFHQYTAPLADINNRTVCTPPDARLRFLMGMGGPYSYQSTSVTGRYEGVAEIVASFGLNLLPPNDQLINQPVIISGCLLNPKRTSHSQLWIRDANMSTPPRLRFGVLQSRDDKQQAVKCLVRMLRLAEELSKLIGGGLFIPTNINLSDKNVTKKLEEYVTNETINSFHIVGTCAVRGVVDRYFRVIGVKQLRVVDASVIPYIPDSVGPLASVYVVANHAAELLISRYSSLR